MKRKTEHDWALIIEAQIQSQLTATEFCRQQGLNDKYFSLRKGRYLQKVSKPLNAFVEAKLLPVNKSLTMTKLHWQTLELELSPTTSPVWLADVMKALVR